MPYIKIEEGHKTNIIWYKSQVDVCLFICTHSGLEYITKWLFYHWSI